MLTNIIAVIGLMIASLLITALGIWGLHQFFDFPILWGALYLGGLCTFGFFLYHLLICLNNQGMLIFWESTSLTEKEIVDIIFVTVFLMISILIMFISIFEFALNAGFSDGFVCENTGHRVFWLINIPCGLCVSVSACMYLLWRG